MPLNDDGGDGEVSVLTCGAEAIPAPSRSRAVGLEGLALGNAGSPRWARLVTVSLLVSRSWIPRSSNA